MSPIGMEEVLVLAIVFTPIALVFYLGWRFVRALEQRKGSNQKIDALTSEIRALRAEVALMTDELGETEYGGILSTPSSERSNPAPIHRGP